MLGLKRNNVSIVAYDDRWPKVFLYVQKFLATRLNIETKRKRTQQWIVFAEFFDCKKGENIILLR